MRKLVLIPGLLCNHRLWAAQIAALSEGTEIHVPEIAAQATVTEMAHAVGPLSGVLQMKALLDLKEPFRVAQISCRTVVNGGSDDRRTTPADHEALAREIPHASFLLIEEAAHFTPLEQPARITAALQQWIGADDST